MFVVIQIISNIFKHSMSGRCLLFLCFISFISVILSEFDNNLPLRDIEKNLYVKPNGVSRIEKGGIACVNHNKNNVRITYIEDISIESYTYVKPRITVSITKNYGYPHFTFNSNHIFHWRIYCDIYRLYVITGNKFFILDGITKISSICYNFGCDDSTEYESDEMFPFITVLEKPTYDNDDYNEFDRIVSMIDKTDCLNVRWYNDTHYMVEFNYFHRNKVDL